MTKTFQVQPWSSSRSLLWIRCIALEFGSVIGKQLLKRRNADRKFLLFVLNSACRFFDVES